MKAYRTLSIVACIGSLLVAASGCATMIAHDVALPSNAPNARYLDGRVVHASVGERSIVEVGLRRSSSDTSSPVVLDVYVENLGSEPFNFGPGHVRLFRHIATWGDGRGYANVTVHNGVRPEDLAASLAQSEVTTASTTGGLGMFLSGGTAGEILLAGDQASMARANARNQLRAAAQNHRQNLIALTTLRPGDSMSGGVGFVHWHFSAFDLVAKQAHTPRQEPNNAPFESYERLLEDPAYVYQFSNNWNVNYVSTWRVLEDVIHSRYPRDPVGWTVVVLAGDETHSFELVPTGSRQLPKF